MLFKQRHASGRTLYESRPLLISPQQGYIRPKSEGKEWFMTTTSVWNVDELIKRRVRDWRRLTGETGHTGERTGTFREDHNSHFTGTHSVFAAPLVEWILLRYSPQGGKVLDAFAGGPPRAVVSSIMGFKYFGFEIRQQQIDENLAIIRKLKLPDVSYICGDGRYLETDEGDFDVALTCPPYFDLEVYSDHPLDISNLGSYAEFNNSMRVCAASHTAKMKPGAFVCIVVGNFCDKKGELIDFRSHTVENFQAAGFAFHQDVILVRNFGSAAKRASNAWKGQKLVARHEHLLVFRKPK